MTLRYLFATEAQSHGATLDAVGACQRQAERSSRLCPIVFFSVAPWLCGQNMSPSLRDAILSTAYLASGRFRSQDDVVVGPDVTVHEGVQEALHRIKEGPQIGAREVGPDEHAAPPDRQR